MRPALDYERRPPRRLSRQGLLIAVFELVMCCFYGFAGVAMTLAGLGVITLSLSSSDVPVAVAPLGLVPLLPGVLLSYFCFGRVVASLRVLVRGDGG